MRRLFLLATVAIAGLLVYRQRTMDRWERTLGIGGKPGGSNAGGAGRG